MTASSSLGTLKLNLGCGTKPLEGYANADRFEAPWVDVVCTAERIPLPDASVWEVRADDVLEHVLDFPAAWREMHRVLRKGGLINIRVPIGDTEDPFHARVFTKKSLKHLLVPNGSQSLERETGWYAPVDIRYYIRDGFPWWHLYHYFKLIVRPMSIRFRWVKIR